MLNFITDLFTTSLHDYSFLQTLALILILFIAASVGIFILGFVATIIENANRRKRLKKLKKRIKKEKKDD